MGETVTGRLLAAPLTVKERVREPVGAVTVRGGVRSTSLSMLGIADEVREIFAEASGLAPARFSFNSRGGCPACKGKGYITTQLAFLDDVSTP